VNHHEINAIEKQIRTIVADLLCLDECSLSNTAHIREELGADSLDTVELVMALADTFDVEFCEEDGFCISTISDIADYIAAKSVPIG
jgi:acyl carrier protein